MALAFLSRIILGRTLGLDAFGVYSFLLAMVGVLVLVAQFGFPVTVLRFLAEYRSRREWGKYRGMVRHSTITVLALSVAIGLGALVLSGTELLAFVPATPAAFAAAAWIVVPAAAIPLIMMMLRASGHIVISQVPGAIMQPTLLAMLLVAAYAIMGELSVLTAIVLTLIATGCTAFTLLILFRRATPPEARTAQTENERSTWSRVAFPFFLNGAIGIVIVEGGILLAGVLTTAQDTALFAAASAAARVIMLFVLIGNSVIGPEIPDLLAAEDRAPLQRLMSALAHVIFWPALVITAVLLIAGNWILFLFGPEFVAAWRVLGIMSLGHLATAAVGSAPSLLAISGHQKQVLFANSASGALLVVGGIVAAASYGILGIAIVFTGSMIMKSVWIHAICRTQVGVSPSILHAIIASRRS